MENVLKVDLFKIIYIERMLKIYVDTQLGASSVHVNLFKNKRLVKEKKTSLKFSKKNYLIPDS